MSNTEQKLPPLYKNPVPLVAEEHKDLKISAANDFKFARDTNSVIVTLTEVPAAAMSYPVVFSPLGDTVQPVVILGYQGNSNAFVDADGVWRSNTYIPAYVRRYPFIFMENAGSDVLTLCVDMEADVIGTKKGKPIFDGKEPTEAAKQALNFCEAFNRELAATNELCKSIVAADILDDKEATVTTQDGKKAVLQGFQVIDEEKLNALDDEAFLKLRAAGALPLIYSHLLSMRSWNNLLGS